MSDKPAPEKHPQFILAVDNRLLKNSHHFPLEINKLYTNSFLDWPETQSALTVRQRRHLEGDESYRQIIPYTIVRRVTPDSEVEYLPYQRLDGVGEQRLAGKVSVGFGGHIDLNDISCGFRQRSSSVIDLRSTLLGAATRELREELGAGTSEYRLSFGDRFIAANDGVNAVHLGVIMFLDVPYDADPLTSPENELNVLPFSTADTLLSMYGGQLERWSQLFLESVNSR